MKPAKKKIHFDIQKKQLDKEQNLIIEGYANRAAMSGQKVIDRGNEHIPKEEWKIANWMKNPVVFFNHDRDIPIGKGIDAKITDEGLWVKIMISNSDAPDIKKARDLINEEILQTFSVGIDVENEEKTEDHLTLKGVELLEVSVVSVPMNQESFFAISNKKVKSASELFRKKGAYLASALHHRIWEMQKAGESFNREEMLALIAEQSGLSQEELYEILVGNNVQISDELMESFSVNLEMDKEKLEAFHKEDLELAGEKKEPEMEDENENEEGQEDENEKSTQENQEKKEDEEGEEKPEENEEEQELQADQSGTGTGDIETDEEQELETVDPDATAAKQSEEEDLLPEEDESKACDGDEEDDENKDKKQLNEETIKEKIKEAKEAGKKGKDQYLAFIIDSFENIPSSAWKTIFKELDLAEKEGVAVPLNTEDSASIDHGNASLEVMRQHTALLGQVISELKVLQKLMSGLIKPAGNIQDPLNIGGNQFEKKPDKTKSEDDQELPDDDEELTEENEALDNIKEYEQKLEKRLAAFSV